MFKDTHIEYKTLLDLKDAKIKELREELARQKEKSDEDKLKLKLAEQKFVKNIKQVEVSKMKLLQKIKYHNSEISQKDKQLVQMSKGKLVVL